MKNRTLKTCLIALFTATALLFSGCSTEEVPEPSAPPPEPPKPEPGTFEKLGKQMDDAAADAKESETKLAKDTKEQINQGLEDAKARADQWMEVQGAALNKEVDETMQALAGLNKLSNHAVRIISSKISK